MKYGILEIQEVYSLWKAGDPEKKESFAVSFSSSIKNTPLIYVGSTCLRKFLKRKIFDGAHIAYLHSLKKSSGESLFPDAFIKLLSEAAFHLDIEAPLEGSVIFSGEPVLKISGRAMVMPFFKKLLSYYLPVQIEVATEVEKIRSYISPAYVVIESSESITQKDETFNSASAYIGGAIACEDLAAAAAFQIPMCYPDNNADLIFLNISDTGFNQKVALLQPEDKLFLKGGAILSRLEDYPYLISRLKGVSVSIANLCNNSVSMKIHEYTALDMLDKEFNVYRFSEKGLYIGDILTNSYEIAQKKTVLGRSTTSLEKKALLEKINTELGESISQVRSRALKSMRQVPCKYQGNYVKDRYPIRIVCKGLVQANLESELNTNFA